MPKGKQARDKPLPEGFSETVKRVAELYPKCRPDGRFFTPDGTLKDFGLETFLSFMSETSMPGTSPGEPWKHLGCASVGDVLREFGVELYTVVKLRLQARLEVLEQLHELTADDLVRLGLRDVVRVFVKNEPHTLAKILADRLRLIMNSGLADVACDRIVLEALAEVEIENWGEHPSMPGMGLDDESLVRLRELFLGRPHQRSTDVKAYDFSVTELMMLACAEVELSVRGVGNLGSGAFTPCFSHGDMPKGV
jgi:hypothetical protein